MTDFKTKMAELAAKYNISHKRDIDWHNFVAEVEQLFHPELKESEDERIIKFLKHAATLDAADELFQEYGVKHTQVIAWLERQKEQKPTEWSEEDEKQIRQIERIVKNARCTQKLQEQIHNWLKSLPERFNLQSKQEWSEEDEDMLNSCISSIEEAKENRYAYKETDGDTSYDHEIAWLKLLRNRVGKEFLQPHWKPSEQKYDGNMDKECIKLCDILNSITSIDTFESCCGHLKDRYSIWFFCNDIITISRLGRCVERNYSDGKWELLVDSTDTHPNGVFWLRSKVPFQSYDEMEKSVNELCNGIQHWFNTEFVPYFNSDSSHWKPSEEQMKALLNAEGYLQEGDQFDSAKSIAQLYEQLKKL